MRKFKLAEIVWKMEEDGVWVTVTRDPVGWSVTVGEVYVPRVERIKPLLRVLRSVVEFARGIKVEDGKVYKDISFLPPRVVWKGSMDVFNVTVTVQGNFRNVKVEDKEEVCDVISGTPEWIMKVAELFEAALKFIEAHDEKIKINIEE